MNEWEAVMKPEQKQPSYPVLGPDDPPIDFSREEAAYERERERMVRDHLGQIALIHEDEVVGAFPTAEEAISEGFRRFGLVKMMLKEIRDPDTPAFMPLADINHPSFQRIE